MIIIKNIAELVAYKKPSQSGGFFDCSIVKNAAIIIDGKMIIAAGAQKEILKKFKLGKKDEVVDAKRKIAIPGFVDCHTHLVYGGSRAEEYELKLKGLSYTEIHKRKGGIHLTVEATRKASEKELYERGKKILDEMLKGGTTTVEIKSGYGLDFEGELKILRAVKRLKKYAKQDIVATFLGAHTVPLEFQNNRVKYVSTIIKKMLPAVKKENLAEYCDVFCDPLGFTVEESRNMLLAAKKLGFKLRLHAEQTAHFGGIRLAAELGAASAEHCDFADENDIGAMKEKGVVPVFLPGVLFHLSEWEKLNAYSPFPKGSTLPMAEGGISSVIAKIKNAHMPYALATDYNPGSSPVLSMKLVMDMAMRFFGMTYCDCLYAATLGGAESLGKAGELGSIEAGNQADILLIDAPSVKDYLHQIGDREIACVIKSGDIVV